MDANMFTGPIRGTRAVGVQSKGRLPGPAIEPYKQMQPDRPMSDMQTMQQNERRQHEQTYIYENGHNDHGMGQ
jgi:hypothetical protein